MADSTEGAELKASKTAVSGDTDLREYGQLTELLSLIPHKVQRGLRTQYQTLELTCLDANSNFIALGSNVGVVFLYDRDKHKLERLRSESSNNSVTCVKLHQGLDDLVAVGYQSGSLYIFQLPSILIGHSKKLERFVVSDLHTVSVTSLAWSTNGMKLYSGDTQGGVGCTEVDFQEGQCKSSMLLIEKDTEIVQLDQAHKSLLISTRHRCVVCRLDDHNKLVQIGQKERKIPGSFGACFIPALCKPDDAKLYAVRPGFRLWLGSVAGTVLQTYMFKELLGQEHPQISLASFQVTSISKTSTQQQFGPLLLYRDRWLVTWNEACLYVLNRDDMSVVGSQRHVGHIQAVVTTGDELFLLRTNTDRNLIRLALGPIQSTGSRLLQQLALERKERDRVEAVTGSGSERSVDDSDSDASKDSKPVDASPKLFLKTNFLDKVKKIPAAGYVKKIKKKLKDELTGSSSTSQPYRHEDVFQDSSHGNTSGEDSELPPVVQLASPDLLKITLTTSLDAQSGDVCDEVMTDSNVSVSAGESSRDVCGQSDNKTGDCSDEIQTAVPSIRLSAVDTGDKTVPPDRSSRFSDITVDNDDEDSIVFNTKPKQQKGKKKKKGGKEKGHKGKEVDQDSLSVNSVASMTSATSVTSDSSENVILAKQDEEGSLLEEPSAETGHTVTQGSQEEMRETTTKTDHAPPVESDSSLDRQSSERSAPVTGAESAKVGEESVVFDSIVDTNKPAGDLDNERMSGSVTGPGSPARPGSLGEFKSSLSPSAENSPAYPLTSPDTSSPVNSTSLEKAMAQLDSYLGEKPVEQGTTDSSQSDSVEAEILHSRRIADIYTGELEDDSGFKSSYQESDLDAQLHDLDRQTLATTQSNTGSDKPDDSQPSIYSIYKAPDSSAEDFYSKYTTKRGIVSSASSDPLTSPEAEADDLIEEEEETVHSAMSICVMDKLSSACKSVNTWTELIAQGNIYSLSLSDKHVWYTDKSNNIYYSGLSAPGVSWRKATGSGRQIAVSRLGTIVWCLQRNTVMAGTKITPKRPEGMKWVEAVKDVNFIAVDETCAWYIKTSGEVMMQKGLSRERPCYTATSVDCPWKLKQVVCQSGVVWALTEDCQWVVRQGVTRACPEGVSWLKGDNASENKLFSCLALGAGGIGWAMDVIGDVWFCCGVTMEKPRGDNLWWQVPFSSEYIMKDMTAFDQLKSLTKKLDPQKLALLLSTQRSGLLCANQGVWVCPEFKHLLHVCRGSLEGQYWGEAHPENLAASSCWKTVVARNASQQGGFIWAQQPNGDLFMFTTERQNCTAITTPKPGLLFVCIAVCTEALWGLTDTGDVYIRTGMGSSFPQGSGWVQLDLSQLGEQHLVHVSCGQVNVWAVDTDGDIYHRIGVKAPSDHSLNAAWLPVDNGGTVFTQVLAGSQDWMVWAVDNRRQVYFRSGITREMPIGRKWVHVPGTPATKLTLSDNHVWALNPAGELLCRYGVTMTNVAGDYWKKMPGGFTHVSASPADVLWGINREGQLIRRETKYIIKKDPHEGLMQAVNVQPSSPGHDEGEDWEFV